MSTRNKEYEEIKRNTGHSIKAIRISLNAFFKVTKELFKKNIGITIKDYFIMRKHNSKFNNNPEQSVDKFYEQK
jgi:hypothetical protein